MDKNTESLIRKLENQKFKGIKVFVDEIEKASNKQDFVNELYRNLSENGINKLDKVIQSYNNQHKEAPIHTHNEFMKEYEDSIIQAVSLLEEYGEKFETESKEMDDFIKFQFEEAMFNVKKQDVQDVIDEISNRIIQDIDKESNTLKEQAEKLKAQETQFNTFSRLSKQYGETNHIRIRVSDINKACKMADKFMEHINAEYKETSPDKAKEEKIKRLNDFKYTLLREEKSMKPDDFQALINALDKKLDFEGRKTLDSAIRYHNKGNPMRRYETRRITLSEKEKDASWQKFETDTLFSRKLREFRERLHEIHKNRYRPEDKYDRGIINGAMRAIANANILIAEVADFIRKNIEYRTKSNTTNEKEHPLNPNEQKSEFDSVKPFYDLIKDAYKEKGSNIVALLNDNKLDFKQAEDMFINDVAYISTQSPEKQQELFVEYTNGLRDILKDNVNIATKNQIMQMIANMESGLYDSKINEKIEKGFDWSDIKFSSAHSNEQDLDNSSSNYKRDDVIYAYSKEQQDAQKEVEIIKAMHEIGTNIASKEYIDGDSAMKAFVDKISFFSHLHQDISKEKINMYTQIAVAVVLSHNLSEQEYGRDLKNFMYQYSSKTFNAMDDKSIALKLLDGASKIDYYQTISSNKHHNNLLREDLHNMLETKLCELNSPSERQKFISSIADNVKSDRKQYILTCESRKFALKAISDKQMPNTKKVNKKIQALATRYTQMARKENYNLIPSYAFVGTCDKIPEKLGGAQVVYDTLKNMLKDNQKAFDYMQKDADMYNSMNKEIGLKEISFDNKEIIQNELQDIEKETKENVDNNIFIEPEENLSCSEINEFMSVDIPAENVEYDEYDDFEM